MHVVVGNELHSRYDKVELILPDGVERQINKARGVGVSIVYSVYIEALTDSK